MMNESQLLLQQIQEHLGTTEEDQYWNNSLDILKSLIKTFSISSNQTELDLESKNHFLSKLDTLIHLSRKKHPHDSLLTPFIKSKLSELSLEFNDLANSLREELLIAPYTFDLLTKQSLSTDKEINLYKTEMNKHRN